MAIIVPSKESLRAAALWIREGGLVAFPTETVYGLGADATNGIAVARIFAAKGRPRFNPLIVHVADVAGLDGLAEVGGLARRLARAFWPGPLTLVLAKSRDCPVSELATAGLPTVAVRIPSHPVAQALIRAAGRPIVAPSANRSGRVSPTTAQHVVDDLGAEVMVLDGGACRHGLESTVLSLAGASPTLLRAGAITAEMIEAVLGVAPKTGEPATPDRPSAPGQLASHYAPNAPVRLMSAGERPKDGEALLAFGPEPPETSGPRFNLSPEGDLEAAAARLYEGLRTLDALKPRGIAVAPVPATGLGAAINDRLKRAAAPRS